ncbi:MAG TPA: His/Gly/Thr/Pro-type tRNA ligase C-terminal domain-containing protein, partial [Acidobacteriota bacterium]|nr:His/Gly/Thr/Pro-type tRNA ligase C-terminal domain-containing protein [Acidobacteriota bacterium]
PRRFDITYMGDDSKPHHVVMIHRALLGSLERFMGVLIEHYAGAFPVWLAPIQVSVIPVSEKFFEYGQRVAAELKRGGLRVELDDRNEKVGYKIRSAEVRKIPYMLVVGQREASSETVSVRERQTGDLGSRSVQEFLAQVQDLIAKRALTA